MSACVCMRVPPRGVAFPLSAYSTSDIIEERSTEKAFTDWWTERNICVRSRKVHYINSFDSHLPVGWQFNYMGESRSMCGCDLYTCICMRWVSTSQTVCLWLAQWEMQQKGHRATCSSSQWSSLYSSWLGQVQALSSSASTNRCPGAAHGCCRCVWIWVWQQGSLQRRQTFRTGSGGPRLQRTQCSTAGTFSVFKALNRFTMLASLKFFSSVGFWS